jgi:predicted nucleic acid-binding protein
LDGLDVAEIRYRQGRQAGFEIISPGESITREAAIWKVKRNDLSLGDCFALATMKEYAEILLTTDSDLSKIKEIRAVYISPLV